MAASKGDLVRPSKRLARLGSLLAALLSFSSLAASGPATVAAAPAEPSEPADAAAATSVTPALSSDGTFIGVDGVSGSIDLDAWSLVAPPEAGVPPRFAPAKPSSAKDSKVVTSAASSWLPVALAGATDGALNSGARAIFVSNSDVYVGGTFTNAAGIATADYIVRWSGTGWLPLGSNGGDGALNGQVNAIAQNIGHICAGGTFTDASGIISADYLACFNGSSWYALGMSNTGDGALNGPVSALQPNGFPLLVGGSFTNAGGEAAADYIASFYGVWAAIGSNGSGNGALNNSVLAIGFQGADVIVGGKFTDAGGAANADRVARWNGATWSDLSSGSADASLNNDVNALALLGGQVVAGGAFTDAGGDAARDYIARWTGSSWSALGSNGAGGAAMNGVVTTLAVRGGHLIAGGLFTDAGGQATADFIADWDGAAWRGFGSNGSGNGAASNSVYALGVQGNSIYTGGDFSNAGGDARADYLAVAVIPGEWSGLGSNGVGNGAVTSTVNAVAVVDNDLYIGGSFSNVAGVTGATNIARWNGDAWSAVGATGGVSALNNVVKDLAVMGGNLYVAGLFINAAGIAPADYLAEWNGTTWSAVGSSTLSSWAYALAVDGSDLYVGGVFLNVDGIQTADRIARWDGVSWSALAPSGATDGSIGAEVDAIEVVSGDVYVGGNFINANQIPEADYIARFNGVDWFALGSNGSGVGALNARVTALATAGSNLFVGGNFTNAAGKAKADYVAQWNGSWSAMGANAAGTNGALNNSVYSLLIFDDALYVGGAFTSVAGVIGSDYLATWDSTHWSRVPADAAGGPALYLAAPFDLALYGSSVVVAGFFTNASGIPYADYIAALSIEVAPDLSGAGLPGWSALGADGGALNGDVKAIAVAGPDVYVGGSFTNAGGIPEADYVARWDGSLWSALGSNGPGVGAIGGSVNAIVVDGVDVYVGGGFTNVAGIAEADNVARWNGTTWSALGSTSALNLPVFAMADFQGSLIVGGSFTNAGGVAAADNVARWNGAAWSALGSNESGDGALSAEVAALLVANEVLYVGGSFNNAAGIPEADSFARWNGTTWTAIGSDGNGDGVIHKPP
ncbi:MAG: hypothetical protein ABIP53_00650, partial [Candidatus Limnocylindrales bacterium]